MANEEQSKCDALIFRDICPRKFLIFDNKSSLDDPILIPVETISIAPPRAQMQRVGILVNKCDRMHQIDPVAYGIPEKIAGMKIQPMSWEDFKGTAPEGTWFMAMIWWAVDYKIIPSKGKQRVTASARVLPKSWVNYPDTHNLLVHQYGHYLIGCLCALRFMQKVNHEENPPADVSFKDWCQRMLQDTIRQYSKLEKKYDDETDHFLTQSQQILWDKKIREEFKQFDQFFQQAVKQQSPLIICEGKRPKDLQPTIKIVSKTANINAHSPLRRSFKKPFAPVQRNVSLQPRKQTPLVHKVQMQNMFMASVTANTRVVPTTNTKLFPKLRATFFKPKR